MKIVEILMAHWYSSMDFWKFVAVVFKIGYWIAKAGSKVAEVSDMMMQF